MEICRYIYETICSQVEPVISDCCCSPAVHSLSLDLCNFYSTNLPSTRPSPVGHPFHRCFSTFPASTILTLRDMKMRISSLERAVMSPLEQGHVRLGHIGLSKIIKLAERDSLRYSAEVMKDDKFKLSDCSACQMRKTTKLPKNEESPRGTKDCEMIHVDIAGPFDPSSNGNTYYLALIDNYSRVNSVVPIQDKKNILGYVQLFVMKIERQLGGKTRFIWSDGGLEFKSKEAITWYATMGIIHQISPRYTPELNRVAERFNRTIKEMISSMLSTANVGHEYWDFAARYASMLLMKTSISKDGSNP